MVYVGHRELAAMALSETRETRSDPKGITCCGQILDCAVEGRGGAPLGLAAVKSLKGKWEEPWPKMTPTTSRPDRKNG